MNITLKPQHQKFIEAQINSGKFNHPDEVVDLAFRLLEKFHDEYQQWLEETRHMNSEFGIRNSEFGNTQDSICVNFFKILTFMATAIIIQ